jgi:hypothetical protein
LDQGLESADAPQLWQRAMGNGNAHDVEYQWQSRGMKDRHMTTARVEKVMVGSWCNDDSHHNSFKYLLV